MKKIFWIIPLLILVPFLGAPAAVLKDAATGVTPQDMHVVWPLARYALEPLAGFGEYVLSFSRYIFQLISWLAWMAVIIIAAGIARRRPAVRVLKTIGVAGLTFLTLVVLVLLLPLPAPRLVTGNNVSVADLHSHTVYSHDGVKGPAGSLAYHRRLGFDVFFDSEHNHTRGFDRFPASDRLRSVYPGMQISTTDGISLLVLADRPFDGAPFKDRSVKEVIDRAHADGFVVICPHWWKWHRFTWQELADAGIDGFEVYNAGYRTLPETEQKALIDFCRERKLFIAGTTDWHGWGHLSDVWTVLDIPKSALTPGSLFAELRAHGPSRVVVYSRPEAQSTLRYVFEPFYGAYYYLGSLDGKQLAGWGFWILAAILAFSTSLVRRFGRFAAPLMAALLLVLGAALLVSWLPLAGQNQIIPRLAVPVLLVLSAGWLAVWRLNKHG